MALNNKPFLCGRVSIVLVMLPAVMLVVVLMVILVCMKEEGVLTILETRFCAHSFCSCVYLLFHNMFASA